MQQWFWLIWEFTSESPGVECETETRKLSWPIKYAKLLVAIRDN